MEHLKMKRAREGEDENEVRSYENNTTKKRDLRGLNFMKDKKKELVEEKSSKMYDSSSSSSSYSSQLTTGVFDFPWLKDGVICKSDDYYTDFDDKFSLSLERQDAIFGIEFSDAYGFCETPKASLSHILDGKVMENLWQPFDCDELDFEAEDVDCIWSSLFNKPIKQPQQQQKGDGISFQC